MSKMRVITDKFITNTVLAHIHPPVIVIRAGHRRNNVIFQGMQIWRDPTEGLQLGVLKFGKWNPLPVSPYGGYSV